MQQKGSWTKWSLGIHPTPGFYDQMTSKVSSSSESICTWNIVFSHFKLLQRLPVYFCFHNSLWGMSVILMSSLWSGMQPQIQWDNGSLYKEYAAVKSRALPWNTGKYCPIR